MNVFIPIAKVDAARREVWGWAAEEAPDKSGEIMDYDTSKPLFMAWSETIAKNSDGKSLGNVRAMHGNVAAGRLIHFEPHDDVKKFYIGAHVVDDAEWKKVETGVYTGFSVGGSYAKRWQDGALKRYTAQPAEISLVDNPCMYGATFEMVKADGMERVEFVGEPVDAALTKFAGELDELSKAGARHSSGDMAALENIVAAALKLGATCPADDTTEKADTATDLAKNDDLPPWLIASMASEGLDNVASVTAMLGRMAAALLDRAPEIAGKLSAAAVMVGDVVNDLTAKIAAATAAQAEARAQMEATEAVIEQAVEAAGLAMMAKFEAALAGSMAGDDAPLTKALHAATEARATADSDLLAPLEKRFDDVAARLGALETQNATIVQRVTSFGPVVRAQPAAAPDGVDLESALTKLLATTQNPIERQILSERLAGLQIAKVHAAGGNRVG